MTWYVCEVCKREFRPLTERAKSLSPSTVGDEQACWPCHDGFYDCCWGPTVKEFKYRSLLSKPARSRQRQNELKRMRRENRTKKQSPKQRRLIERNDLEIATDFHNGGEIVTAFGRKWKLDRISMTNGKKFFWYDFLS